VINLFFIQIKRLGSDRGDLVYVAVEKSEILQYAQVAFENARYFEDTHQLEQLLILYIFDLGDMNQYALHQRLLGAEVIGEITLTE